MSKFKIGFIIFLGLFTFSGNSKNTISDIESEEFMDPVEYVICGDDGFAEINISNIQSDILIDYLNSLTTIEEGIIISTRTGSIIKFENFLEGPVTSEVLCNVPYALTDVGVDENGMIHIIADYNSIRLLNEDNCSTSIIPGLSPIPILSNSLSFDTEGNMYFGGFSNVVYRYDSDEMSPPYIWHDFQQGMPSGDFVILGNKMYISWLRNGATRLYEVTIDNNFNYISHVDLGIIPSNTYGLASELGELYGVTPSILYRINLEILTISIIATNDFSNGEWWGAAGLHEAYNFETSSHINAADANSGTNPLPDIWNNTQQGSQTIYIRIENTITGETEVVEVNLIITDTTPEITMPSELVICTEDTTSFTYDLTTVEPELLQSTSNPVTVSYHNSESDAELNLNAIDPDYTTTATEEIIYVRVENVDDNCFAVTNFNISINFTPSIVAPTNLEQCESESNGIFTLTDIETELLQNNIIPVTVSYHANMTDANLGTNVINTNYQITSGQETIFVRVESTNNSECFEISQFDIILNENPQITTPNNITQCENNNTFNLTQIENELLQNNTIAVIVTYYTSWGDATTGTNPINTNYQISPGQETIFIRVENANNGECFETSQFDIILNETPQITTPNNITQCENDTTFDLTQIENELLQNNTISVVVTYYTSLGDATTGTNPINTNYQISPGQETIFVRVENTNNSNCFETSQFEIILNESPQITTPSDIMHCADDGSFDLTQVENELTANTSQNVIITYHTTLNNANTNTDAINTNYNANTNQDTIYVRVQITDSDCFAVTLFNVITFESLEITIPSSISFCENEIDGPFDLTQVENELLQNVTQNITVSYHDSLVDAETNTNSLSTNYTIPAVQATIYIRVEDNDTNCFETTQFTIQSFENPIIEPFVNSPSIRLLSDCYIDTNLEGYFDLNDIYSEIITNGNTDYTLEFYLSEEEAAQEINTINAIYYALGDTEEIFVVVTNNNGCKSMTNFFINPDCYDTIVDIANISFPEFFTPNNDYVNDTWNVKGISVAVQQTSIMYIFDRYGKLLYYFRPGQIEGWNGTYKGRPMPSNDYWYKFQTLEGQIFSGSFSLIR
ncbi:T9SS type B sorting domain-containing protein [Kordia sp.]|uniref:T9SS type B sorting domain-containing protein n=1 Tax=Kordia sp. TaxID=1965332 RepID=UPI003D6B9143